MLRSIFCHEVKNLIPELFANCVTFENFEKNLIAISGRSFAKDFVLHGFSALVEAIITYEKILSDYRPFPTSQWDLRVHGMGQNAEKKSSAVGLFFVEKIEQPLTANGNHLTTFFANAMSHYSIPTTANGTLLMFSNAESIHQRTIEQFITPSVLPFLRKDIQKLVDNKIDFWNFFRKECEVKEEKVGKIVLRKHQVEAVEAAKKVKRGKIILPTGTGKSLIEASIIEYIIEQKISPVVVIATPRIVLTYQLLNTIADHLASKGIDAQYVNLNSGNFDEDDIKRRMLQAGLITRDVPSTTSPKEIETYYHLAQKQMLPLIIGSTYHSAPKIHDVDMPVDLILHDEAHNLVDGVGRFSNDVKEQVHKIEGEYEFFFTATEAFSANEEGTGMNNKDLYGEVIYSRSPKEMMDAGEIVPPYIHVVSIDEYKVKGQNSILEMGSLDSASVENNIELAATVIVQAYEEHRVRVKEKSASPEKIGAKLLIVCKGEQSLSGFKKSEVLEEFKKKNPSIKFFAISSASGAYVNGDEYPSPGRDFKEKFMIALRTLKDEDDAIIFHIDMIGEGIDIPGITGVMAFRDMGTIKSSQTLGRAERLCFTDRKKLYSGELKPLQFSKMIKPYCWVVIPCYSWAQKDMLGRMKEIAERMRSELGYMPFENSNGSPADGRLEQFQKDVNGMFGKRPEETTIVHEIEKTEYYAEADMFADQILDDEEKAKELSKTIGGKMLKKTVVVSRV